jgi:threonine/homoserine/homoserine lactone efflux protein
VGVADLLYMASSMLEEHGARRREDDIAARSAILVVVSAVLVNIVNPKLFFSFSLFCRGSSAPMTQTRCRACWN